MVNELLDVHVQSIVEIMVKVKEVERCEGLVVGEGGFPKRKLYGLFTRCYR
jgi:hypothetical protein